MSNLTAQERQARLRKKANVGLYLGVLNTILIVIKHTHTCKTEP